MASLPGELPQHPAPPTICRPSSPPSESLSSLAAGGESNGSNRGLSRLSTASSVSHGSTTTEASSSSYLGFAGRDSHDPRDSLGSDVSSSVFSRQSSGSYSAASSLSTASSPTSRLSMASTITANTMADQRSSKRRGYMRPQGTDFAASARSRESVLSLGSIAHLQHYFARTGLLDLKGQLERKRRGKARTLDLSQLEGTTAYLNPRAQSVHLQPTTEAGGATGSKGLAASSDVDSSYASLGSSPDLAAHTGPSGVLVESPVQEEHPDDDWYADDLDDADAAAMLPPTVSTYMYREKPLPKPPSLSELKADLKNSLDSAAQALTEAREAKANPAAPKTPSSSAPSSPEKLRNSDSPSSKAATASWYEIQGMHILDVITLAIRAAKVYYTSHEHPDRLDAIKPEKEVRSELLAVMDVLKRMATRNFTGGVRTEEIRAMDAWVASLYAMLDAEEAMIAAERTERAGWTWLRDADWPADPTADLARSYAREHAFLQSMLVSGSIPDDKIDTVLPPWTPMDRNHVESEHPPTADETNGRSTSPAAPAAPTPFLQHMQNGVRLVQLHNCAVRKSHRRFGAIPTFHADTQKPYRAADNLRYWVKAAELRWEVLLKIDALGVVCNSRPDVWPAFEDAIFAWSRKVREEITAEFD